MKNIKAIVAVEDVSDFVIELSQLDDVSIKIEHMENIILDADKQHGYYMLDPATLATIIISVMGTTASLVSLATAIIQYKSEKEKRLSSTDDKKIVAVFLQVGNDSLDVNDFHIPEALAKCLYDRTKSDFQETGLGADDLLKDLLNID